MYRKILIPVDMAHLEKAPEMIDAAKHVATEDSQLVLANIIPDVPALAELSVSKEFFEQAESEARNELLKIADDHEIEASVELRTGQAANEILEIQKECNVDLVIIGSHRPGLQDYFLGSTASRVVRHAQCPVLVMR